MTEAEHQFARNAIVLILLMFAPESGCIHRLSGSAQEQRPLSGVVKEDVIILDSLHTGAKRRQDVMIVHPGLF